MTAETPAGKPKSDVRAKALKFVLAIGILSFFADFTYEGSRSILGPYLATLHATALAVAFVTGFGELLGYGLRLVSGRLADSTGKFWPITIVGYVIQMAAVPLLALAGSWRIAAVLIILERVGKATRNPPRDVMLSHAGKQIGRGWAFGVHEALDQFGALVGPLLVALVLARNGDYSTAFAILAIPGAICLAILMVARWTYPHPEQMETRPPSVDATGLPAVFWWYMGGAALVAAGFVDFPFVAFHFARTGSVSRHAIPVFYAVAMGVSGTGSLIFGRLYDRIGFGILIALTPITAVFAPLVFWGGTTGALIGAALWGLGMGVHESLIPAAVAPMVSPERRASAYGLFTAGYGIFWFLGSLAIGVLYRVSIPATVAFCVGAELAAVPLFIHVHRSVRR